MKHITIYLKNGQELSAFVDSITADDNGMKWTTVQEPGFVTLEYIRHEEIAGIISTKINEPIPLHPFDPADPPPA
jgi:hypothetical protein